MPGTAVELFTDLLLAHLCLFCCLLWFFLETSGPECPASDALSGNSEFPGGVKVLISNDPRASTLVLVCEKRAPSSRKCYFCCRITKVLLWGQPKQLFFFLLWQLKTSLTSECWGPGLGAKLSNSYPNSRRILAC